jgi:hypothetical protein
LDGVHRVTLVDPDTAERSAVVHGSDPSEVRPAKWSSAEVQFLREQLTKHREVLVGHWTDDTIYPGSRVTKTPDQPASHGQCGVSSAWLLRRLGRSWRSDAYYCVGDVLFGDGEPDVAEFHCWVEIGDESSAERLVVDLTCDQFEALGDVSVLCEERGSLMDRSIRYEASSRRRFKELRDDSVWGRYKVLDQAISRTWLKSLCSLPLRVIPFVHARDRGLGSVTEGAVGAQSTEARAA